MKKILSFVFICLFLTGCVGKTTEEKKQSNEQNYFEKGYLDGLNKSYSGSKDKIQDATDKENKKIQDALDSTNETQ